MANLLIKNPKTDQSSFGSIVATRIGGVDIPGGPIYLKPGEHKGPNKGYGAVHIWAEHQKEMKSAGFDKEAEVGHFVAQIIQPGSQVFCELARLKGGIRVSIVRSVYGTAILEHIGTRGNSHYSVVTAYKNAKTHGTKIGTVR